MNAPVVIAPVGKSVRVKTPVARAFDVLTSGLSRWWPLDHGVGGATSIVGKDFLPAIALGACPNSRCSILSESDSTFGYEQVFSPLEYRSDAASAAECAGLRAERPCVAVYR